MGVRDFEDIDCKNGVDADDDNEEEEGVNHGTARVHDRVQNPRIHAQPRGREGGREEGREGESERVCVEGNWEHRQLDGRGTIGKDERGRGREGAF